MIPTSALQAAMDELIYNAGDGHPQARQMLAIAGEINNILNPQPVVVEPVPEPPANIDLTFDELFGGAGDGNAQSISLGDLHCLTREILALLLMNCLEVSPNE